MAKLILALGGAKSGKSAFAENLARNKKSGSGYARVAYLATAEIRDNEMAERVLRHKERRPKEWQTIEAHFELEDAIVNLDKNIEFLIIDCITIYITNLLLIDNPEIDDKYFTNIAEKKNKIFKEIEMLCDKCKLISADVVMVSNEVGFSVVPENKLARVFTDIAGTVNQIIAQNADEVYLIVAGIAQKIK